MGALDYLSMGDENVNPQNREQREAVANLGATANDLANLASLGNFASNQRTFKKGLAPGEEIADLRKQALQSIRRGETAAATPGTSMGLNAGELSSLQSIFPKMGVHLYDQPNNGNLFDFGGNIAQANVNTGFNQQYANAEKEAALRLMAVQQQAENAYANPIMNVLPGGATQGLAEAKTRMEAQGANTAATRQSINQAANNPTNAYGGGEMGYGTYAKALYNPQQDTALPKDAPPEFRINRQLNQSSWNPDATKAPQIAEMNNQLLTSANQYNQSSLNEPTRLTASLNTAKAGIEKLKDNKDYSSAIQNAAKDLPPVDYTTVNSWWNQLGDKLGTSSQGKAIQSQVMAVAEALPPEAQVGLAKQFASGTVTPEAVTRLLDSYSNQAAGKWYGNRVLGDVLQASGEMSNKGYLNGQNLQSAILGSKALNMPPSVDGSYKLQDKLMSNLEKLKAQYGNDPRVYPDAVMAEIRKADKAATTLLSTQPVSKQPTKRMSMEELLNTP